jgi:hypothetical protein
VSLKNYNLDVNPMPNTQLSTYNAHTELKDGVKLCPGQTQTGFAKEDWWYIGDCPSSIAACASIINLVLPYNPNFALNGTPQPAVPDLLNSCR